MLAKVTQGAAKSRQKAKLSRMQLELTWISARIRRSFPYRIRGSIQSFLMRLRRWNNNKEPGRGRGPLVPPMLSASVRWQAILVFRVYTPLKRSITSIISVQGMAEDALKSLFQKVLILRSYRTHIKNKNIRGCIGGGARQSFKWKWNTLFGTDAEKLKTGPFNLFISLARMPQECDLGRGVLCYYSGYFK